MIVITNHPIGGPVFSGPQVTPYHCNPNASNPALGAAIDEQCNAPTKVDFLYRNASNQFVAYDPANPPAAVRDPDDDDGRRQDGAVHRPAGHGHGRSRHLPDRGSRRSDEADRAVVDRPAVEPQALLPVRRRMRERPHAAGALERAPGDAARPRLRGRQLEPQHLRPELRRRRLGRGDDDDQGDRGRALRPPRLHDGDGRLGGVDAAAPDLDELPGPARRAHRRPRSSPTTWIR